MLFSIRNSFEDRELPVLYEIEKECFTEEFRWAEPTFKQEMLEARKHHFVWVALIGVRIVGFLIAALEGSKVNIDTCDVTPSQRGKGIATRLIAACEQACKQRGYKAMKLEVFTENPAQILYFQLGYRVCGFKRNYYGMRKHAISMAKKL